MWISYESMSNIHTNQDIVEVAVVVSNYGDRKVLKT